MYRTNDLNGRRYRHLSTRVPGKVEEAEGGRGHTWLDNDVLQDARATVVDELARQLPVDAVVKAPAARDAGGGKS